MNTALFDKKMIYINQLHREHYQMIHDAGKKGKLFCPVCEEPVRFYLGIENEPHFFHLSKGASCQDPIQTNEEQVSEKTEYVERNGFKIPVSRSITTVEQRTEFKNPQPVKKVPVFTESTKSQSAVTSPYIEDLRKHQFALDANQSEALLHTEGPLLVIAGAGSGKTRVLTARTAYMIHEKKIDPQSIMLVTFTAKAAAEMKHRLQTYPKMENYNIGKLLAGTFHSIFYRILSFHDRNRWSSDKLLKKEWQKEQIIKDGGRELELDEKEFAYDLAIQQIGFWKNSLILPSQVRPESPWEEKVAFLYNHYEKTKQEKDLFDFDDMLVGCYQLFQENPSILAAYQNRFQYFLIDEFQDINKVQYELIRLLCTSKNICAVGDDDQSIYSFRGSDPHYLLEFEKDYPNAKIVVLNENYRSSHEIVATANAVIKKNKERRPKEMKAQFTSPAVPTLFYPFDEEEEATMIIQDIQEKIAAGFEPQNFAILFRTNTGSRAVFERLANSSLPFRIDQDVEPFYERFIVKGMVSFLRLALNEDDQDAIRNVLPVLFVKNNVLQDLKAESILKDCSLLECLSEVKTGFAFQERKLKKLVSVIRSIRGLTPLTAIETVEKELGYGDFIKKRGNEGNKLDKGSDDVRDLKVAARGFQTLFDFLEHVHHMTAMNKEMKNLSKNLVNAITLSTIHRSKGLEYKVVYIISTVDGSLPHDYALDSYRNGDLAPLEEERRLLYVAITRAMEQLYISVPDKRRGKKAHPSRFLAPIK
ncbi:ATP-dependent DNA helicase Rep [Robertmurraya yapensis]|uniref:DNA 3'-5' helicase n=1 Tax=Bacillus yapensis TaxID=2492960 RepID=A0A3S0I8Q7_9BACI|nr:ATP-dependent helicase [Bacillus yapensis]RTR30052.1 ATP-dependent DNA helicase Rep [Bacillus yapensis]TKS95133.1 ATP-dependent DNA helicase Rep [Bacillus yapensis]